MAGVTNGQIVERIAAVVDRILLLEKKFDVRHVENVDLMKEIKTKVDETNGRVTKHDIEIAVTRALLDREREDRERSGTPDERSPRTVLKIGGGTGLGVLLTKFVEWIR